MLGIMLLVGRCETANKDWHMHIITRKRLNLFAAKHPKE